MVKSTKWTDFVAVLFSLVVIGSSTMFLLRIGAFAPILSSDTKLSWHLVRSTGISAYILMTCSMIWGLLVSGQTIKHWSPGALSMTLHASISWLAVILALIHALLLMLDTYYTYRVPDLFIPFTGPYRPIVVGFGTLAFWISLIVAASFQFKRFLGNKAWKWIHMTSYAGFLLVSLHGVAAGTDGETLGFRLLVSGAVLATVLLLGMRVGKDSAAVKGSAKPERVPRSARTAAPSQPEVIQ
jgi:predicted ferric reductase